MECFLYNAINYSYDMDGGMMMKDWFMTLIKGLFVGSTMLVPGVSGGSMAMILGIYDRLITAVSSFRKDTKKHILFLLLFSLGGLMGMVLFANPILTAIALWTRPMLYFFIGIVLGGVPLILKKANVHRFHFNVIFLPFLGVLTVFLLTKLQSFNFQQDQQSLVQILWLIIAGFVSAIALVLPGISVSYMLLLLGMYDTTMHAISECYLPFLIPLGIGLMLGIISTTKLLEMLMKRYTQATYLVIFGFVIGSVFEILPGLPLKGEWILCMFSLCAGILLISILLRFDKEEC